MFRLIKLTAYALFGYALYELIRGMIYESEQSGPRRQGGGVGSRSLRRALNEDSGRMNVTGPGRGVPVATQDADGGSTTHTVGRGVVS